eukprot:SAG31_NODE_471_length_15238_cov_14.684554_12_plen_57_part_00
MLVLVLELFDLHKAITACVQCKEKLVMGGTRSQMMNRIGHTATQRTGQRKRRGQTM